MRRLGIIYLLTVFVLYMLCGYNLKADDDIIRVQTLTFDSIFTRCGEWKFPVGNDTYRKILMNYTLKCDPKTLWDKYNCGEWDYLTYSTVTQNTGVIDSMAKTHPQFKLGTISTDTLVYIDQSTSNIPKTIKQKKVLSSILTTTSVETEYAVGAGDKNLLLTNKPFRMQFIISKDELKNFGVVKGKYAKFQINVVSGSATLKNFTIKYMNTGITEITKFDNTLYNKLYENDLVLSPGLNTIILNDDISINSFSGILVEISADGLTGDDIVITGFDNTKVISSTEPEKYFKFDNSTDYITSNKDLFHSVNTFTFEGKFKVDNWKSWSNLVGCGDKSIIQLGETIGELYCIIRDPMNSYGKASNTIELNKWYHLALVYDASQTANADRLKLYINGELASLEFTGYIPNLTSSSINQFFTVSSKPEVGTCLNGGASEVRAWNTALSQDEISSWIYKKLDNTHPKYSNLVINYPMDNINGFTTEDESENNYTGQLYGIPELSTLKGSEMLNPTAIPYCPSFKLISSDYMRNTVETVVDVIENAGLVSLAEFEIADHNPQIKSQQLVYLSGTYYKYDANGAIIDSTIYSPTNSKLNSDLNYFSAPYEVTNEIEIGRYITPYGSGLDLGPDGVTWVYDVTDYVDILKGDVKFNAGNFQELIDVRFDFYKGVPPRNVINMNEVWGPYRSYLYKNMASGEALPNKIVQLTDNTKQVKIKTRFTGHGHNKNADKTDHCCEWKNNTHYLYAGNDDIIEWHIWQEEDCAMNPIFPQNGTWLGSREGWCPGDKVKENEFELTKYVKPDNSLELEYTISSVPQDNLGMGEGNYIVAMQLFEYAEQNHQVDAEVYDIFAPNRDKLYSRKNPICKGPIIVIRNNGTDTLKSLKFEYYVSGGAVEYYDWTGALLPNIKDTVTLPISGSIFWNGDGNRRFTVEISEPNSQHDQYSVNNKMSSKFYKPDIYTNDKTLKFKTNSLGNVLHLTIKDSDGNIMVNRSSVISNSVYTDKLDFPEGCYTLEIINDYGIGLYYYFASEVGTGYLQILNHNGEVFRTFEPDFGLRTTYSFVIGSNDDVPDKQQQYLMNLYPIPAEKFIKFSLNLNIDNALCELYDGAGRVIKSFSTNILELIPLEFDMSELSAGNYFVRVRDNKYDIQKSFIKK